MNIYGVRGYLTPDNLPEDRHCRTFSIPNDVQWLSVFMGALLPLIYPENWQAYGELTPEESADGMLEVIWQAYNQTSQGCTLVEAPYWDTIGDADAEVPIDGVQTWYGYVVPTSSLARPALLLDDPPEYTFIERIQDWVIAAFIVYSGQPAAAIFFLTIAPKFRLAWKTGDLGGLVRVFVDAVEYGRVDTYSPVPGEVHMDVYHTDPDIDEHELLIILDDETSSLTFIDDQPVMSIIRKKLDPAEVANPQIRYNPDTNSTESDFDGDDVWQPNPGLDIRSSPAALFPPVDAADPQCQAAANMTRYVSDFINDVGNTLSWATAAEGLLTTVMGAVAIIFPEGAAIGVFALLGLDLATTLFSAGLTAVQAAFDNDTLDTLTCIFYCNLQTDGSVTADGLAEIQTEINDQIGGLAATVLAGMFFLMGTTGLSNAGSRGDAPSDCSECGCGWCHKWNATEGWGDWYGAGGYSTLVAGVWESGRDGGASINALALDLPDTTVTHAIFRGHATNGANGGNRGIFRIDPFAEFYLGSTLAGDIEYNWVGVETGAFTIQANLDSINDPATSTWHEVILRGTGDDPFGGNNC